jgi:hypothetical protein
MRGPGGSLNNSSLGIYGTTKNNNDQILNQSADQGIISPNKPTNSNIKSTSFNVKNFYKYLETSRP